MADIVHAFFLGAAFVVGAFVGLVLCLISHGKGREQLAKEVREHNKLVESRLLAYVENTGRLATAAEMLVSMKDEERRK